MLKQYYFLSSNQCRTRFGFRGCGVAAYAINIILETNASGPNTVPNTSTATCHVIAMHRTDPVGQTNSHMIFFFFFSDGLALVIRLVLIGISIVQYIAGCQLVKARLGSARLGFVGGAQRKACSCSVKKDRLRLELSGGGIANCEENGNGRLQRSRDILMSGYLADQGLLDIRDVWMRTSVV